MSFAVASSKCASKISLLFPRFHGGSSGKMSSLRAFRIQKSRPITSSPSSVGDAGDLASSPSTTPAPVKRLDLDEPNSQETQNGANGNSNHVDDSSEDIIRPLVRFDVEIKHFIVENLLVNSENN